MLPRTLFYWDAQGLEAKCRPILQSLAGSFDWNWPSVFPPAKPSEESPSGRTIDALIWGGLQCLFDRLSGTKGADYVWEVPYFGNTLMCPKCLDGV